MHLTISLLTALAAPAHAADDASFLRALIYDFEQDGMRPPRAEVEALYKKACDSGVALACKAGEWHRREGADLTVAVPLFQAACDAGETISCLVPAWAASQHEPGWTSARGSDPKLAVKLLTGACDKGLQRACSDLGVLYRGGIGMKEDDDPKANSLFEKACSSGDEDACFNLGYSYRIGSGVDKDFARSDTLYARACDMGAGTACTRLGQASAARNERPEAIKRFDAACDLAQGYGCFELGKALSDEANPARDAAQAVAAWQRGCDIGSAPSCNGLGELHAKAGDAAAARTAWIAGCELPGAAACMHLGPLARADAASPATDAKAACDAGRGDACFTLATAATPADNDLLGRACNLGEVAACTTLAKALPPGPTATDRWRQACALRDAKACVELGALLTKSAPAEAALALRAACSMGDTQACVTAAGIEASTSKDNLWDDARSLCDNGDPRACTEYGVAILRTDPLDGLGAIPWLTKACEGGDGAGCRMAGNLHSASAGIGRDVPKALDFLDKGCKLGDVLACERLTWHYGKGIGVAADAAKVTAAEASACAVLGKEGCAADWRAAGPTWVKQTEPEFPSLINPKSIPFGLCRVRVTVSKSGSVSKVDVVDCDARFDANTLEAVKKWKAEPGAERAVDVRVIYGAPK